MDKDDVALYEITRLQDNGEHQHVVIYDGRKCGVGYYYCANRAGLKLKDGFETVLDALEWAVDVMPD